MTIWYGWPTTIDILYNTSSSYSMPMPIHYNIVYSTWLNSTLLNLSLDFCYIFGLVVIIPLILILTPESGISRHKLLNKEYNNIQNTVKSSEYDITLWRVWMTQYV